LVEEFAANVKAASNAFWSGEGSGAVNRFKNRYIRAFKKLRDRGDQGRDALAALFFHPSPDVLRAVAMGEGLVAFEAAQALERGRMVLGRSTLLSKPIGLGERDNEQRPKSRPR